MPAEPTVRPSPAAILAARVGVPGLLVALVAIESRGGVEALPFWIDGIATRFEISAEMALRLLIGVQLAFAVAAIVLRPWSRAISLAAALLLSFAAIAELSALAGRGVEAASFLPPAVLLALCGLLLPPLARRPAATIGGGSPAWRIVLLLAIATASVATAARIPISPAVPTLGSFSGEIVELAVEDWVGKTIPETGLGARVPKLTALTLEGRSAIVLYNPHCGSCHEFFESWFATPQPFRVIALEVPPEAGAVVLESDQPDDIACAECERLSLPTGPLWLVKPPVLVLVEDGRVRCVAAEPDQVAACLGPWRSSGS
ncbi:MAG: hypothetical protein ACO3SJ_01820 [Phycisphaerales bacterium]